MNRKRKTRQGGGRGVQFIGQIDIQKFSVVSPHIRTDEVIITDERLAHIKQRHPGDFERYENYLKDIIQNPQYILEDNSPATAVVLNEYEEDGKRFRLILRLSMPSDPADYKNSVMTFSHKERHQTQDIASLLPLTKLICTADRNYFMLNAVLTVAATKNDGGKHNGRIGTENP